MKPFCHVGSGWLGKSSCVKGGASCTSDSSETNQCRSRVHCHPFRNHGSAFRSAAQISHEARSVMTFVIGVRSVTCTFARSHDFPSMSHLVCCMCAVFCITVGVVTARTNVAIPDPRAPAEKTADHCSLFSIACIAESWAKAPGHHVSWRKTTEAECTVARARIAQSAGSHAPRFVKERQLWEITAPPCGVCI